MHPVFLQYQHLLKEEFSRSSHNPSRLLAAKAMKDVESVKALGPLTLLAIAGLGLACRH